MSKLFLSPDLQLADVEKAEGRIWQKIRRLGPDDCWLWLGSCSTDGYGQIRIRGRLENVSRVLFLKSHGWLPPVVMHSCDNPPCCNPGHFVPGTKALNNADKMRKGRFKPCIDSANGMTKVKLIEIPEIVRLVSAEGWTQRAAALKYGVSPSAICRILNGERKT